MSIISIAKILRALLLGEGCRRIEKKPAKIFGKYSPVYITRIFDIDMPGKTRDDYRG
jgi:hypothetical protein